MADRLHELRGTGYASRFLISASDLPPGWRQERRSSKYTVWYDDKGRRYKSSHKVERALRELPVANCNVGNEPAEHQAEGDTPTCTETGGETSEFEPSPAKRP